jgi:thiosulfate dehydrogenase [quinone] large subunit
VAQNRPFCPAVAVTFGLGYSTSSAQSWLNGGSPTKGFLSGAIGHAGAQPQAGWRSLPFAP